MKWFEIPRKFGLSHKPSQKSHFVLQISQLSKIVQNWFCIYHLRMDLSFQEKKKFVNILNDLQVTSIFVILENSGVFIETPCITISYAKAWISDNELSKMYCITTICVPFPIQ